MDKCDRDHALDAFPDELDRVEIGGVRRKRDEHDAERLGGGFDRGGAMTAEVVQNDDDRGILGVGGPDVVEKSDDGPLRGILQEAVDTVAYQGIEGSRTRWP